MPSYCWGQTGFLEFHPPLWLDPLILLNLGRSMKAIHHDLGPSKRCKQSHLFSIKIYSKILRRISTGLAPEHLVSPASHAPLSVTTSNAVLFVFCTTPIHTLVCGLLQPYLFSFPSRAFLINQRNTLLAARDIDRNWNPWTCCAAYHVI